MFGPKTKLMFTWLLREKKFLYKVYLLALVQGGFYTLLTVCMQSIVQYNLTGSFSASLVLLCTLTIGVIAGIGILQIWQMRLNETLQQQIFCRLTQRTKNLNGETPGTSDKILHFFEVVTIQKGIGKILLDFSFSIVSIIFGLIILPVYSNIFLFFSLLLAISFYLVLVYYGRNAQESNLQTSTLKYRIFKKLQRNEKNDQLDADLGEYLDSRVNYYKNVEKQYQGILIFKLIFISILLFLGAYLVHSGSLTLGQFVASEVIIWLVINAVEKLVGSLGTCYDLITALYKIEDLFQSGNVPDSFVDSELPVSSNINEKIYRHELSKKLRAAAVFSLIGGIVILFLPWTQTVEAMGKVSAISPEFKPQQVTTRIAGRVEKWYISDGQFVNKNDTIAFLSEIKEEYLDTSLVSRVNDQVIAKESSIIAYESKINAINEQIDALNRSLRFKSDQLRAKIRQIDAKLQNDSADAYTALNNLNIAKEQYQRYESLFNKGVISKTDLESRQIKLQEAQLKKTSADNKILGTKNEKQAAEFELSNTIQEFNEKLMKADSDKFSTMSLLYESEGALTKLQNQLTSYSMRNDYYYILAPQSGYISNLAVRGVGEIVKEGGIICDIVTEQSGQAVEIFVTPADLPLIRAGQKIQLEFDGWPAFVFSGWPVLSYGTYSAEVVNFDRTISTNGKFRVLAKQTGETWPIAVQQGCGVRGIALLNRVSVGYELWRKLNAFPPDYYQPDNSKDEYTEKK
jgi:adhesin transport system membrane fusion protein